MVESLPYPSWHMTLERRDMVVETILKRYKNDFVATLFWRRVLAGI